MSKIGPAAAKRAIATAMTSLVRLYRQEESCIPIIKEVMGEKMAKYYELTLRRLDTAMTDFLPTPGEPYTREDGTEIESVDVWDEGLNLHGLPSQFAALYTHDDTTLVVLLSGGASHTHRNTYFVRNNRERVASWIRSALENARKSHATKYPDVQFPPINIIGVACVNILESTLPHTEIVYDASK